jgi:hypothetical protein
MSMSKTLLRMFVLIVGLTFVSVSGLLAEESQTPTDGSVETIESIPSQQPEEGMTLPEGIKEIETQSAIDEPVASETPQGIEELKSEVEKD